MRGFGEKVDSGIVRQLRLCWVKGVFVFRCNLPPVLFVGWPRSFTCHCGNTGVERIPNKSQHTKLTSEKKILPPLLPGFELAIFRSRVRRATNKLSRLPSATIATTNDYKKIITPYYPPPPPAPHEKNRIQCWKYTQETEKVKRLSKVQWEFTHTRTFHEQ